jgi:hypothetical protein
MLNNLSLQVRSSTSNDELDRRYQCYKLRHPRSPPFNLSLGCESWGVRGGGEQLQHEHDHLRPRTLQSVQSISQKDLLHPPAEHNTRSFIVRTSASSYRILLRADVERLVPRGIPMW